MIIGVYVLAAIAVLGLLYLVIRAYVRFRGGRLVTCPETQAPVAVKIGAFRAALTTFFGASDVRLRSCTRWPERRDCDQACLQEIEAAGESCAIRTIIRNWYEGKVCVYCNKPLEQHESFEHGPCLLTQAGNTLQWSDVRPETIPDVLMTCRPVCWNCHITETFRGRFPELVLDRDRQH
jgi:hypothetical protein